MTNEVIIPWLILIIAIMIVFDVWVIINMNKQDKICDDINSKIGHMDFEFYIHKLENEKELKYICKKSKILPYAIKNTMDKEFKTENYEVIVHNEEKSE